MNFQGPKCDPGWIVNEGLGCVKPLAEGVDATTPDVRNDHDVDEDGQACVHVGRRV